MKKRNLLTGIMMIGLFMLASCTTKSTNNNLNNQNQNNINSNDNSTVSSVDTSSAKATDAEESKVEITNEFSVINDTSKTAIIDSDGVYTITEAGEYSLSGKLVNGMVYINAASDAEVILNLNGVSMSSNVDSCIYVESASKVEISAKNGTYNEIYDTRDETFNDDTKGNAAIYSNVDLKLKGKGNLYVNSTYNNGIQTKDDLEIKNITLKVVTINNALKGNDSVTVESGNIILVSSDGDGIKTENSDISSKGNQRGNITISGGTIDIYAACDGIDASYDVIVNQIEGSDAPNLNIYTANYSSYSNEVVSKSTTMYLKMSSSYTTYRYALYFYNDDETDGVFKDVTYKTMMSGGRNSTYYYYECDAPSNYTNVKLYAYSSNQTTNSISDYYAVSKGGTINSTYDTLQISSISNGNINYGWTIYQTTQNNGMGMPGGMDQGNTNKLDYSAKGIKSENNISISAGIISISATDDSIHSNRGTTLENGSTGEGSINISGGSLTLSSKDDGVHADYILTIAGGNVTISESHEGIEGNQININGGDIKVNANDDGINAGGNYISKAIKVTGGNVDINVGSGDTDGIDSNGTYTQTGGFVISRVQATGGGCGALDCDGTITITGGTFIGVGPIESLPSNGSINLVRFGNVSQMGGPGGFGMQQSSSSSYSFGSGTYRVYDSSNNELFNFELSNTYTSMWIASTSFALNQSYVLKNSSTSYSWTQSSNQVVG